MDQSLMKSRIRLWSTAALLGAALLAGPASAQLGMGQQSSGPIDITAIIGQTYLNVEFLGEAGHAGTVPMLMRRDALAGAAEAMLLGETLARETKGEVVATVGRLTV